MLYLSVITVTYCSERQIECQIRSVQQACQGISYEHILVDNHSSDKTVSCIRSFGDSVVCIENAENLGFAAANLLGYQRAEGRYLLFLNPDMELEKEIGPMLQWMEMHREIGIAGCRLVDSKGNFNHEAAPRRFPRLHEQFILLLKLHKIFPKTLDRYFYKDLDFMQEQQVDSVRGSFMLMRRAFVETVGWPFDPRYFIWFEDVDICREAWKHGFSVHYTPLMSCKDAIGQSFKQRQRFWKFRQYADSLLCYLKKWEPIYVWCWVLLLYKPIAMVIGSMRGDRS